MAQADVYIGVSGDKNQNNGVALGIAKFAGEREGNAEDAAMGDKIHDIVRADLLFSRYFDVREEGPVLPTMKPGKDLDEWKKSGAQYVIAARASNPGKMWTLSATVYEATSGQPVLEKYYRGDISTVRKAAHMFSDEVVNRLTGKAGIATTRIVFANDNTGNKEIYTVDYDGENLIRLTNDKSIALLPKWSPDGTKIYYTTYRYRNPDMFEIDLKARKIRPVSTQQGLNLPGGVSPDGDSIAMTLSRGKNPNIYILGLANKDLRQITSRRTVDSSASYSPDGKYLVFVSNRTGNPQVHTVELATGKMDRLTNMNWTDSPRWSPTGEWIVFAGRKRRGEPINIFLIDITGNQLRQLTKDAGMNEDPTWSPDGRFIAFTSTRNSMRQIYVMDVDGSAPHLVAKLPGKAYTPSWSR